MRLLAVEAHNFLSLRNFRIDDLDKHLNFLVGPNGSGKTSVFRVVRTIRDAFDNYVDGHFLQSISELGSRGLGTGDIDLTMRVEFDQLEEQELLTNFLCAALSNSSDLRNLTIDRNPSPNNPGDEVIPVTRPSEEGVRNFAEMLLTLLSPKEIPFFFEGDLRMTYRMEGLLPLLRLSYTFNCAGTNLTIVTGNIFGGARLCLGNPPSQAGTSYSLGFAWINVFESAHELRAFAEFISGQTMLGPALPARFLLASLAKLNVDLSVRLEQPSFSRAQIKIIEFCGIQANNLSQPFTFARLISILLHRTLVFTNNQRTPVTRFTAFSWEEISAQTVNLDDETWVPLWLYRLKNGTFSERQRFQHHIQEVFRQLVGGKQSFDLVATALPESRGIGLEIDLRVVDDEGDTSLAYEGAGIWEAVLLSTLLEASAGHIIMLDEPASNLHPGMQRKLMEFLWQTKGQIIVVTHSPYLLPTRADEFHRVRRLQKNGRETLVFGLNGLPTEPDEDKLEQNLMASRDLAGLLFANGVILVEGPHTEVPALNEWFPKSHVGGGRTFADLNIALYPVIGASSFAFYFRFLQAFGVKWVVVCDGDSLEPISWNGRPMWKALKELNLIEQVPEGEEFKEIKAKAEQAGIYSPNEEANQKFEHIPDVARYMAEHGLSSKNKADGRQVGQALLCPPEFERILQCALQHLGLV